MENNSRKWGIVLGLAIAAAGAIAILTGYLPARMAGLPAILAIAVIAGTHNRWRALGRQR